MKKNKSVIISQNTPYEIKHSLKDMAYNVFEGAVLPDVDKPVADHIDMQLVKCSNNGYLCAPNVYDHYKPIFDESGYTLIKGYNNPVGKYPSDIRYNIAVTGKYALHNFKYSDPSFTENADYININVNQGYTKCNVCVVGESAIITSDEGIANALLNQSIDVLLIKSGYINLSGYSYGFIGGCTGLIEKDLLAFAGEASTHPDYELIKFFCKNHGVEIVSLSNGELVDIGTITALG